MIIKKLDIENFGKFSGKTIEFKPGFNMIFGKNEKGKTTLMSFLKLLFYGGSSGKSTDIAKNIRRKYIPWNGSSMSGAAEFSSDGQDYRLHKEFKKTAVSDKTNISNLSLGEKVELPPSTEVGEYFLDMELGEFERSVFIENYGGFSSEASGDSLAMRIANLSVSGNEGYSHEIVLTRIASAREELVSKNGKKGLLVDAQLKLDALNMQKEELLAQERAQFSLMESIATLKTQINDLDDQLERIALLQKTETAKKDLKVFTSLDEKYELYQQKVCHLDNYALSRRELEELIQKCNQLSTEISQSYKLSEQNTDTVPDTVYHHLLEIQKELSQLDTDYINIDTKVRSAREKLENSKKKASVFPLVILAVLSVISGISAFIIPNFLIPGLIGFGLCGALCIILLLGRKNTNSIGIQLAQREYETELRFLSFYNDNMLAKDPDTLLTECTHLKNEKNREISDVLAQFNCADLEELGSKTYSAQNKDYTNTITIVNNLKNQYTALVSSAKSASTYDEATQTIVELTNLLEDIKATEHDIKTLSNALSSEQLSQDYVKARIKELVNFISETPVNDEVIFKNPSEIKAELSKKRAQLGDYQSRITIPEISLYQLESQIAETEETFKKLSDRYKSLELVTEAMNSAISQMNQGFGSHLSKKTGEYLSLITDGKYDDVLVSRDLNPETRSNVAEGYHPWKYLSSGATDRVYLALRLAVTDIIAEKHNPLPLFLDDVLAQYDEESCRSTLKFLNHYLKNSGSVSQILFFTCHRHIAELARETIDEVNEIEL